MIKYLIIFSVLILLILVSYPYLNMDNKEDTTKNILQKKIITMEEEVKSIAKVEASKKIDSIARITPSIEKKELTSFVDDFPAATEYNRLHNKDIIDEEQILLEINGKYRYNLDEATLTKIQKEIDGVYLEKINEAQILSEINGEHRGGLEQELLDRVESEIQNPPLSN